MHVKAFIRVRVVREVALWFSWIKCLWNCYDGALGRKWGFKIRVLFCRFWFWVKELGCGGMTMSERKTIDLEQGWEFMQKGITKLKNILEGLPEAQFSSEDYMMLYTYPFLCCFASLLVYCCNCSMPRSLSLMEMIMILYFFLDLLCTEPSITCVLRSLLMITPNSFMTSTGSHLKNT